MIKRMGRVINQSIITAVMNMIMIVFYMSAGVSIMEEHQLEFIVYIILGFISQIALFYLNSEEDKLNED
jgi:threonine/homoserine/homoserine lactone efflux protein